MSVLDDPSAYQRIDCGSTRTIIRDLPRQCRVAWREGQALELPPDYRDVNKVVILGMGGLVLAGDLLRSLAALESPVPIFVHRDYAYRLVDERTLIIAMSYSSETEETLSAFKGADTPAESGHRHRRRTAGHGKSSASPPSSSTTSPQSGALGFGQCPLGVPKLGIVRGKADVEEAAISWSTWQVASQNTCR
jgi:hypothetical protein